MDLFACYRFLLGLYPNDFRGQFSDEMLQVFKQRAHACLAVGKTASIIFVVREFFSLLRGAQAMWIEKILPMKRKQQTGALIPEGVLSVEELRKLREDAISRMVQAIATHDFPGARHYSDEEVRLKALLGEN